MAPAAVEDRAAEDERPEISPVDDPEIEDERPELSLAAFSYTKRQQQPPSRGTVRNLGFSSI